MNRRHFLKSGFTLGLISSVGVNKLPADNHPYTPIKSTNNRLERYKKYKEEFHYSYLDDNVHIKFIDSIKEKFKANSIQTRNNDSSILVWCSIQYIVYNAARYGDCFVEVLDDNKFVILPCETVYRIETIKGKLLEFQQSREGPDYQSLSKIDIASASPSEIQTATAIRFHPDKIVHFRPNCIDYYPYGTSVIETGYNSVCRDDISVSFDELIDKLKNN